MILPKRLLTALLCFLSVFLIGALLPQTAAAQKGTISGIVTDSANTPLAGAQVTVPGSNLKAITDESGHFVIGAAPGFDNITVVSACSGHGFKFAPVLGEIAADLAVHGGTQHPIALFGPARLR